MFVQTANTNDTCTTKRCIGWVSQSRAGFSKEVDQDLHREIEDDVDEDSDTSNAFGPNSDSCNLDGWATLLDVLSDINDHMEFKGLTLKAKKKKILKEVYN